MFTLIIVLLFLLYQNIGCYEFRISAHGIPTQHSALTIVITVECRRSFRFQTTFGKLQRIYQKLFGIFLNIPTSRSLSHFALIKKLGEEINGRSILAV